MNTLGEEYKKAIIYCRVSSERQVREGHGLDSQEHRCRTFADTLGLKVEHVFKEQGISGGLFDRPAMKSLFRYLDKRWQTKYVVIFDDLKRFARDVEVHIRLKTELKCREAKLACLNYNFDDSAEGEFVETIFAAQNELERKQNRRQVCQKMKARMERGYWCFGAPSGYVFKKDKTHGKLLTPIEPVMDILSVGLNDFAENRLLTQTDFLKFLRDNNFSQVCGTTRTTYQHAKELLSNPLYAGLIEYPKWDITRRQGQHKAIISEATFDKIQYKLRKPERKPRETDNVEFPLRRIITCAVCGKKMTGSSSRGKNRYYSHYTCNNKKCSANPKNIRVEKLEADYIQLLEKIKVRKEVLDMGKMIAKKIWDKKIKQLGSAKLQQELEKKELEKQIDDYIDLIPKTKSESIRSRYEQKIEEIDKKINLLNLANSKSNKKEPDINEALYLAFRLLGTPAKTWINSDKQTKIMLHDMIFTENPIYSVKTGFGTPKLSLPFLLMQHIDNLKSNMVELRGVEPLSKT